MRLSKGEEETNTCVEVIIFHNLGLSVAKRKHKWNGSKTCSPFNVYYFTEVLHIKPEKVVKF